MVRMLFLAWCTALMPAGLLANPTSFIRKHSGTACFYDAGMSAAKIRLMGKVPEAATDCTSNCCITDPPAEYEAGKDYILKVTNSVGEALVGTASGTIDGAHCKSAGKTYQGKVAFGNVKWTAPAAGTGDVEVGITCASGYGGTIIAFTVRARTTLCLLLCVRNGVAKKCVCKDLRCVWYTCATARLMPGVDVPPTRALARTLLPPGLHVRVTGLVCAC